MAAVAVGVVVGAAVVGAVGVVVAVAVVVDMKKFAYVSKISIDIVDEEGQILLSDALLHLREAKAFADKHGAEWVEDSARAPKAKAAADEAEAKTKN